MKDPFFLYSLHCCHCCQRVKDLFLCFSVFCEVVPTILPHPKLWHVGRRRPLRSERLMLGMNHVIGENGVAFVKSCLRSFVFGFWFATKTRPRTFCSTRSVHFWLGEQGGAHWFPIRRPSRKFVPWFKVYIPVPVFHPPMISYRFAMPRRFAMPCFMAAILAVLTSVLFDTDSDVEDLQEVNKALHLWKARTNRRANWILMLQQQYQGQSRKMWDKKASGRVDIRNLLCSPAALHHIAACVPLFFLILNHVDVICTVAMSKISLTCRYVPCSTYLQACTTMYLS